MARARHLRPRPGPRPGLLHRRGVRGLRPGARRAARRRRALRRPARPLRARRCRPSASRSASTACTSRWPGRSGGEPLRPDHRGAARRAARRDARPARAASASTPPRCAPTTASCCSSDVGIVTMRPSDVPTYVEAGAADLGITGKDVLMEQSEREVFELLDLGYGGCTMVLATVAGEPDPAAEALRRLGVMRVATKYPRIAAALLRGHRPPGRDRRGQGLGRARAADRAGRGDRRPHRDRHDAARERAGGARGDRRPRPRG